jgi:2-phospho-L-lactate guanylyltransferase
MTVNPDHSPARSSAGVSWCLIPVRGLSQGKTRLDAWLSPQEKSELTRAMLNDILDTVHASGLFQRTLVLTKDPSTASIAARYEAHTMLDQEGSDHCASVFAALQLASKESVDRVVVIAGDVPLLTGGDLEVLAKATELAGSIAVGVSEGGEGTNALGINPPDCLTPLFGPGSCQAHNAAARANGLAVTIIARPGIAFDLDWPVDVVRIAGMPQSTRTTQVARRIVTTNIRLMASYPTSAVTCLANS